MSLVYVALDLETTGLDPARDMIIEIGAVKFNNRGELGTFSSMVNPGRPVPFKITQLTGITDRDVLTAPPFSALREKLTRFVGDAIVVGHNVSFDLSFLHHQNCLRNVSYIDTFELASILMPHESRYSLGKLMDSLGISFTTRHRALDDARASMHLFHALQERAADLPLRTLQIINRAARKSRWSPSVVFREAERRQARGFGSSIGAQLRAKGLVDERPLFARVPDLEPLVPVTQRTALDVEELAAMLAAGGALARHFPNFEHRPQQVEMLRAVARAFNRSNHLIVEAGTGTGKSIAYLLPAIHWAVQNGERVVISTNTINLQDQLYHKDIPELRKILPFDVRAAVLKGRSNYLCMRRLEAMQRRSGLTPEELRVLSKVLVWLPNTVTGDRAELFMPGPREWEVWAQLAADADTCLAERCPHRRQGSCFFYRARQMAENAHLLIVNHALLLSDVAAENRVLPQYNYLIVDEAHHLEDATTNQLGYTITKGSIERLIAQIGRQKGRPGSLTRRALTVCRGRMSKEVEGALRDLVAALQEDDERLWRAAGALFEALAVFIVEHGGTRGQYDHRLRLTRALRIQPEWEGIENAWDELAERMGRSLAGLERLVEVLDDAPGKVPGRADLVQEGRALLKRLHELYDRLSALIVHPRSDEIAWVQSRARNDEIALCAVPRRVSHLVERHLLWEKEAVIFTSATLRTNGDFTFIKERLGAVDAEELAVGSPFDYESQVLLYLPTDIPEPNEPYHQKAIGKSLIALAQATRGRMLVLFTSYSQLRATYKAIYRPLAEHGISVHAQGQGASRKQLLENFRTGERTVLLGTRSFWEGIDVPGEALSCLVIARLPFAVPSDPVFAARSEEMDDPFFQYAVPDAILRFRQGFGRLIRTGSDRGVVVVMDRRVLTKRYGEMFLRSLPTCTTVKGTLADLPRRAAAWIDHGPTAVARRSTGGEQELEYVPMEEFWQDVGG